MNREEAQRIAEKLIDEMFPEESEQTPAEKANADRCNSPKFDHSTGKEDRLHMFRKGVEWMYEKILNRTASDPSYRYWAESNKHFFQQCRDEGVR